MVARERDPNLFSTIKSHKKHNTFWDINNNEKLHYFAKTTCTLNISERPNLHFVGSAEPMPNHDLSGRTDAEP